MLMSIGDFLRILKLCYSLVVLELLTVSVGSETSEWPW